MKKDHAALPVDPGHHSLPDGYPGPPYEVLGVDERPLARFETLAEAETYAEARATETGTTVILSPLARGFM